MTLSQEQINALLEGTGSPAAGGGAASSLSSDMHRFFSLVAQASMESGSTAISQALGKTVSISNPELTTAPLREAQSRLAPSQILIRTGFIIGREFDTLLLIKDYDVAVIFDILMGKDGRNPDLDISDLQVSAIGEVMNQLMGASATALSKEFESKVAMKSPESRVIDAGEASSFPSEYGRETLLVTRFDFRIEGVLESELFQFMTMPTADGFMQALSGADEAAPAPPPPPSRSAAPPSQPSYVQEQPMMQQQYMPQQQPQMMPQGYPPQQMAPQGYPPQPVYSGPPPSIRPAQFSPLPGSAQFGAGAGLDMVMDIPLRVTVELGSTKLKIKDVLDLSKGSVVELNKLAGEPVDLLVNGKLMAKGEVVVINENFGLRITEIAGQAERISSLNT